MFANRCWKRATYAGWCYTSPEFFRREIERIFAKTWQFVGRVEEVAEPGSYLTRDGVDGPVVVIRRKDGVVRAFANACRHRGTQLLSGSGQCQSIVCPVPQLGV